METSLGGLTLFTDSRLASFARSLSSRLDLGRDDVPLGVRGAGDDGRELVTFK